jgi:hypothetical protein
MSPRSKFVGNQKFLAELFTNPSVGISEAKLQNRSRMMQVFCTPSFNRFGQPLAVCDEIESFPIRMDCYISVAILCPK